MKKTVLIFGILSGMMSVGMMLMTYHFITTGTLEYTSAEVADNSTIVLSFLLVFIGVLVYREKKLNGSITFNQALWVGFWITLISCLIYVVAREIIYSGIDSDFGTEYSTSVINDLKKNGANTYEIEEKTRELKNSIKRSDSFAYNALITFIKSFAIGFFITLASAFILGNKSREAIS